MLLAEVNFRDHHSQENDLHRSRKCVVIEYGSCKHEYYSRTAETYIWALLSHVIDFIRTSERHVMDRNNSIMLSCHEYRRTSWDNQLRPFELKTTTAMLWRWVQINQSHLKCSSKVLATVVCALRTIVTMCTKKRQLSSQTYREQLVSEPPLWWRLEATIILKTSSVYYGS